MCIAKEPYIFVIFQGEGPDPLSPLLWIRARDCGQSTELNILKNMYEC